MPRSRAGSGAAGPSRVGIDSDHLRVPASSRVLPERVLLAGDLTPGEAFLAGDGLEPAPVHKRLLSFDGLTAKQISEDTKTKVFILVSWCLCGFVLTRRACA